MKAVYIFICLLIIPLATNCNGTQKKDTINNCQKKIQSEIDFFDTISILGVGDIMLGTDYPSKSYLPPNNDCAPLLNDVEEYLKKSNITVGNLEASLAGNNGVAKHCNNPTQCYVFRMPVNYIDCLINTGFDFLSIANNHSGDFGVGGRKYTIEVLQRSGIGFAGLPECSEYILVRNNIKYGFCAFSPHSGTCNMKDYNYVENIISNLDSICDIVIVSVHGGAEGAKNQHVTKKDEIFLGYNRGNIHGFAHVAIDAGADLVFGHGPHVTRTIELYKNKFIAYSLGNFCTYARFNLKGPNGYAPMINVYLDCEGDFIKGEIIPIYQEGRGIPKIDPEQQAIKKIIELTSQDFPNGNLKISNNGLITKE
jgi:hypothetical protein